MIPAEFIEQLKRERFAEGQGDTRERGYRAGWNHAIGHVLRKLEQRRRA